VNSKFPKAQRIKSKKEISFIHKSGKRWKCAFFSIAYTKSNDKFDRCAVIVSKNIGSAVFRNKAKRVIREIFRNTEVLHPPYLNILIYPHITPSFEGNKVKEKYETWRRQLKKF
jgi:ribonuclease P protein component